MARRVFFSFDYDRDIWRIGQIRNSGLTKPDIETAGFVDSASWESVKRQTDEAIARWINNQLNGTSVTVILIEVETVQNRWVKYEIDQSILRGNGLLGIYIHNVKSALTGQTDYQGKNPFDAFVLTSTNLPLSRYYYTYDWVMNDGYNNFPA
jgi:hypothetical protein